MRDIKFRAWDGEGMYSHENIGDDYDFVICPKGLLLMVNEQFHETGSGVAEEYWRYTSVEAEFMQFTGLTDKNGVDVYEGDICYVEGLGNGAVEICMFSGVEFHHVDGHSTTALDCISEQDLFEVIGNIHQNKELLK